MYLFPPMSASSESKRLVIAQLAQLLHCYSRQADQIILLLYIPVGDDMQSDVCIVWNELIFQRGRM